jgi:hypothetical protein
MRLDLPVAGWRRHSVEPAEVICHGAHLVGVRDELRGLDPLDRLPHVLIQIGERLCRPLRLDADLVLDAALELIVGERGPASVGVVDQHDLLGAEQSLADRE